MAQSNELRVYGGIKLYAGTASLELAQQVADYLGEKLMRSGYCGVPQ